MTSSAPPNLADFEPERFGRLNTLLDHALALPTEAREAFVAQCQPETVRAELAALLALNDQPGPLDQPPGRLAAEAASRQCLGRYQLLEVIGEGGMGTVYRALDTSLQRDVAIKLLTRPIHEDSAEQVLKEARAACALNHPNVVTIHEVGQHNGADFIVMEFVDGQSLSTVIKRGRLPMAQTLDYCRQITGGLAAAHARGLVHRDIKPANVMVTPAGRLKILDFGVARQARTADGHDLASQATRITGSTLVPPGSILGTPGYIAPEVLEGQRAGVRSDVFALGVTLFQLIAGRRPFQGDSDLSVIAATLRDEPSPLSQERPDTPLSLERIVARCLAREPDARYPTAEAVLEDLSAIDAEDIPTASGPWRRFARRALLTPAANAQAAALAAFGVLALAGVISYAWFFHGPASQSTKTAAASALHLAVLPFSNASAEYGDEDFVDGMTDDILAHLALVPDFSVISRTTTMTYKGSDKRIPEIAEELGVHYLLEGSVRRRDGRARITVQLVDGATDQYLWADIYDRDIEDIFAVQNEIARAVAAALEARLTPQIAARIGRPPTSDMEAYETFLLGRNTLYRYGPEDIRQAMELFEQALTRDPDFALARAWLGRAQSMWAYNQGLGPEGAARAVATSRRAVQDQPDLSDAWTALGTALMEAGRYADSEAAFEQALELNPNDAIAASNFAVLASMRGNHDQAIRFGLLSLHLSGRMQHRRYAPLAANHARLGLIEVAESELAHARASEPGSMSVLRVEAELALIQGDYQHAHQAASNLAELVQDNPGVALDAAWLLLASGDIPGALEMAEITYANSPITLRGHLVGALYGYTLLHTGEADRAHTVLAEAMHHALETISAGHESPALRYALVQINALEARADDAFDWLDQAIDFGWNRAAMTELDPLLDSLKHDPRFALALDRMEQNLAAMRSRVEH